MRALNDFEKEVVRQIVGGKDNFLNLMDPHLKDKGIRLDYTNRKAYVEFDKALYVQTHTGGRAFLDEVIEISEKVYSVISLLVYLEESYYVKLIQESETPDVPVLSQIPVGNGKIDMEIHDKRITEMLLEYAYKSIKIEQVLVDYCNAGFKTAEEVRHEENVKWAKENVRTAKYGVIAAVVIGLGSLAVSTGDMFYDKWNYEKEIPCCPADTVLVEFPEPVVSTNLNSTFPTIKFEMVNNPFQDTIKVKLEK